MAIYDPATTGYLSGYLGEVNGITLVDEQGNNDGTITGAVQVAGIMGDALQLDGNDYVNCGSAGKTESFTFSTWVSATSAGARIFDAGRGTGSTGTRRGWHTKIGANDCVLIDDGAGNFILCDFEDEGITAFADGEVYHFALTYDAAEGQKVANLYINGNLEWAGQNLNIGSIIGPYDSFIGANANGQNTQQLSGTVERPRLFNFAATQSQIIELYEEPWPYEVKGLVTQDGSPLSTEVRLYDVTTGALIDILNSDANGVYQKVLTNADPIYAMAVPNTGYRPLVHGPINPALRNT